MRASRTAGIVLLTTPGGIAVVVLDHLGRDAVRQLATFEPEPGSVSVVVRLREAGRADKFAVSVYSPEQGGGELGKAEKCPPKRARTGLGRTECRTLENGTTLTTSTVPAGFSDDNADGRVVFGAAITPEDGTAMAMYESYDDTPAVSTRDLESVLTDPRLTWLTDPALTRPGRRPASRSSQAEGRRAVASLDIHHVGRTMR